MKRSHFHLCLRFGVFIELLLGLAPSLEAKPDFTASEITVASQTVLEGDVAYFKLWLRNRGDENPDWTLEVLGKPKKIFTDMKLGTSYLFRVATLGGKGGQSAWSPVVVRVAD